MELIDIEIVRELAGVAAAEKARIVHIEWVERVNNALQHAAKQGRYVASVGTALPASVIELLRKKNYKVEYVSDHHDGEYNISFNKQQ